MPFDYTPKTISDIVYHDDAIQQLINDIVVGNGKVTVTFSASPNNLISKPFLSLTVFDMF